MRRIVCLMVSGAVAFTVASAVGGCGARNGLDEGPSADSGTASDEDSRTPPPPPPRPSACVAEEGIGAFVGSVPGGPIDFPFVVAGVETQGTHSCPRLFIRAGSDPTFTGPHLEIEVPYPTTGVLLPGPQPGTMTVFFDAGEPWTEEVLVNVTRADGLFEGSPPPEQWRATATISHHDATTDLEGSFVDASYCTNFALCL